MFCYFSSWIRIFHCILDQDRTTLKTIYQAAFRVHIQDMLYKSWQYANKISSFFSYAVVRNDTNNVVYGGDQKKKNTFYSATRNLNLRHRFSFLVSVQSNGLSHTTVDENPHLKFDSLIVLEAALTHPPSSPSELCQKGSQSTGAGQQPVTAWRAASHSAVNSRGFLREFYSFSVFPPLLQLKISCRVCMYSLWILKAMLFFHWMLS